MSYMYICHCLQIQVWLSATFAMTLRGGGEGVQDFTSYMMLIKKKKSLEVSPKLHFILHYDYAYC